MSEREDLGVLGGLLACQQPKPAGDLAEDEVEQPECHDWRSFTTSTADANRWSTPWMRFRHPQVSGLYKAELIGPRGPWRGADQVELATLAWVQWWNQRR